MIQFIKNCLFKESLCYKCTLTELIPQIPCRAFQIPQAPIAAACECISTVHTFCFYCKYTNFSRVTRFGFLCAALLHTIPQIHVNDRFVSTFHPDPLFLRNWFAMPGFVCRIRIFALHHVTNIHFILQYSRHSVIFP